MSLDKAIENGRRMALKTIRLRNANLKRREAAVAKAEKARKPRARAEIPKKILKSAGPSGGQGTLIAEGDSWFDYPFHDVLRILEDDFAYEVESVAHAGDCVEDMAYSAGQLEELTRRLEKLIRRNDVPRAILLSGGGNDIAGDEFAMLLNHALSPAPGLNESIVSGVIDQRLRMSYATIISAVTAVCEARLGHVLPILVHGYDYPIPDGRGFMGGMSFLPGPWLKPGFDQKGYTKLAENIRTTKLLIDRFNDMLARLCADKQFAHVHYVNLRDTLNSGAKYREDWANELHPTEDGFRKVCARFDGALKSLK